MYFELMFWYIVGVTSSHPDNNLGTLPSNNLKYTRQLFTENLV